MADHFSGGPSSVGKILSGKLPAVGTMGPKLHQLIRQEAYYRALQAESPLHRIRIFPGYPEVSKLLWEFILVGEGAAGGICRVYPF